MTNQGYKAQRTTEGKERHREVENAYGGVSKKGARPQTAVVASTNRSTYTNSSRRDHLAELFEKLKFSSKPARTTYSQIYEFTQEHRQDVVEHDFRFHYKRDRNTIYNEAMVKMKPHLRK